MKKIMQLTPCLMLKTNKEANIDAMEYSLKKYRIDKRVIYDQEFDKTDYMQGYEYLNKKYIKRQGFVEPRNALLRYFYNSDYDYAVWMDANAKVSKTCLNDFNTILDAIRNEDISANAILGTLGIIISSERMYAKQRNDYFTSVYIIRSKKGNEWLHGCIIKNFKKYYNQELYIDTRCNPLEGTSEDIYFVRLLRSKMEVSLAPTVTITKPSSKTSTWMNNKSGYDYPPVESDLINRFVKENQQIINADKIKSVIKLRRAEDEDIKEIKPYKTRKKCS